MAKLLVLSIVFIFILRLRFPQNKSIAQIVTDRYGKDALKLIRKYENLDFKRKKVILDIEFLENCNKHGLIPKFVQFKVANKTLRGSNVYKQCQRKLLQQEISNKKNQQRSLLKQCEQMNKRIRETIRFIDFVHIHNLFSTKNDRIMDKIRLTQEKKLVNLGLQTAHETNDPEKVIFNFSNRVLSPFEKTLLAKGLNLSIPPKKLNYGDFLLPFELLYNELIKNVPKEHVSESLEPVGASLKNAAFDCYYNYDPKSEQNLTTEEQNALKTLLKEDDIIIQKSDKGNSVVILNKSDYTRRMNELLSDVTKFAPIKLKDGEDYNYIINQEIRISKTIRALRDCGSMTENTYEKLNPTGTQPSVLYGLSKVHKQTVGGIPKLRPILSAINSPTYKLSQYLNTILKPFTTNEYTAKDSFSFASEIRRQDPSQTMASLDVDSLFTNIPLSETINICCDLVFKGKIIVDGLRKKDFRKLLTLATSESFILFDGMYYKQIDGVAMGSPLGPTLANIFLGHNEIKWLSDCPDAFKPTYYRRYVDDIFLLFKDYESVNQFQTYMNSRHPNMNFTSENEIDDALPFLDIFVSRNNSNFVTSVYRKPTFSGVYTHYSSFLPTIYKTGLVSTLLYRCHVICSDWLQIDQEIKKIKSFMLKNGYPSSILDHIVYKFLNKLHIKKPTAKQSTQKLFQIVLPHLGTYTNLLEKKVKQTFKHHLPEFKLVFIYRATTRLRTLFAFKDRIPAYLSSGIIYKYTCSRCKSTYIGESKRHTKRRFCEHMGISALTKKPLKGKNSTTVNDHAKQCKSEISLDDFCILGRENSNKTNLRIKESLFIHRDKPEINIQGNSIPLALFTN